jgi:hypothetical protein
VTALAEQPVATDMAPELRAVVAHLTAANHLRIMRILAGILANPALEQPMAWEQNVWRWGCELKGQFHEDCATLPVRRAQISAYAAELGLTVDEREQGHKVRVTAYGRYQGVELTVWGLAPQDGGAA